MTERKNKSDELWKFIFSIFPVIDLPFGALSVIYSDHWLFTLCALPFFPVVATTILRISAKKNIQPGHYIFFINGTFYTFFAYFSGPNAPTWMMLINMTVGASFMFDNPKIGQILVFIFSIIVSGMFYFMGATINYSLIILLSLCAFIILFSRTYSYLQMQQKRIEDKNREILDSIHYAKRIQQSLMPTEKYIDKKLAELKNKSGN